MNYMKIIVEKSIAGFVSKVLQRVGENWIIEEWQNAINNQSIVENVLDEPHRFVDYNTENGTRWAIIMPTVPGTLMILDHKLHENAIDSYAGGTVGGSKPQLNEDDLISIVVFGNEKLKLLELRIVHELLHGLNLPADDLHENADQAFSKINRRLYYFLKSLGVGAEHVPFFQRKFYHWLLDSRS